VSILKQSEVPREKFKEDHVIFYNTTQKTTHWATQKTAQKSAKEQMLELLASNGKMTRGELAKEVGVSADTVKQHLANLQKEKRLQRIGGRAYGIWQVRQDE
jgi:predicted HTH transcriptional regulator